MRRADRATTLSELVYGSVRGDILAGRLRPGQRLRLAALTERHGVSLSGVREALTRLAAHSTSGRGLLHRDTVVRGTLGEAIRYLTTLRAFIRAAEDNGRPSTSGYWMPDPVFVTAGRAYSVEHYRRIIGLLQDIGSQSLVNMPTESTFDNPTIGPVLEEMLSSRLASARDRAQVTRLAIDLVADGYGGRQTLFELLKAPPWNNQRDQLVMRFDLEPYTQLARATAGVGSVDAADQAMVAALGGTGPTDYAAVGNVYGKRWGPVGQATPAGPR